MHPFGLYLASVDRDRQQGHVGRDGRPLFAPVDAPPLDERPRTSRRRLSARWLFAIARRGAARLGSPVRAGARATSGIDTRI